MKNSINKYIIITPAFNEAENIAKTIESVVKQSILPSEWIIVDDDSTDKTALIIKSYATKYSWIKYIHKAKSNYTFGEHAVKLFYFGLNKAINDDYKFVMKLDADLEIDRKYFFEYQLIKFAEFEKLGICSGITYSIKNEVKILTKKRPYWHTGGAMKFYRRSCLEDIGGLDAIYGWDGIDEYKAMAKGWKTRTFYDLHVNHLGKQRATNREKQSWLEYNKGKSLYQRGYPFEFVLGRFFVLLFKLKLIKGIAFINGYFKSTFDSNIKMVVNYQEKKFIRKFQYLRIIDTFFKKELL